MKKPIKTDLKRSFLCLGGAARAAWVLAALTAGFGLVLTDRAAAQTFTTLYSFSALSSGTNSDGANPHADLVLSGNTLCGTTANGGAWGSGTVFKLTTDGTVFTNLYSFTGGGDGANPEAGLILSGNALYGTTMNGGSDVSGTVFQLNTDGSGFTNLHSFTYGDGAYPQADLALAGGTLFGSAFQGGGGGDGTLFSISTNGTGFAAFYTFSAFSDNGWNTDGANPKGALVLSANYTVYGTASAGGGLGQGTLFALGLGSPSWWNGLGWWEAFDFLGIGEFPQAGLVLSGDNLYGTSSGPPYGTPGGTVFAMNGIGTIPTPLHDFTGGSDGGDPQAGLLLSGITLYGTTAQGGSSGNGTLFKIGTDGTRFTNLYSFSSVSGPDGTNSDGSHPQAALILSRNTLYGTTLQGGSSGNGTVFSLSLPQPPQLSIVLWGTNVILTWPTNGTGFTLQSATNLLPLAWSAVSPAPVVVNGQYAVTNPISGTQMFYELTQ